MRSRIASHQYIVLARPRDDGEFQFDHPGETEIHETNPGEISHVALRVVGTPYDLRVLEGESFLRILLPRM